MLLTYEEFYPTPANLIEKMLSGIDFDYINSVLEPEAGKGDIADVVRARLKYIHWRRDEDDGAKYIDCIEINPDLQSILTGKGYRVVQNDFLTFRTHKQYDLIVMNPPFSDGDKHLLKALDLIADGGIVVCILNAETLRKCYTNLRKTLMKRLTDAEAQIEYLDGAFSGAERKTDVEVALVKVNIPRAKHESFIFDDLRKKSYADVDEECTALVGGDFIAQIIKQYEMEVEAGIRLIHEYRAMLPYIRSTFDKDGSDFPTIEMYLRDSSRYRSDNLSINGYVEMVRLKYWDALFHNKQFTGMLTSNLQEDLYNKVQTLKAFDFSMYNIQQIQMEIGRLMNKGVEDTILNLFDQLSAQHSWYPECNGNIHYYNGWATNKAYCINKKVIQPIYGAFSSYSWSKESFEVNTVYKTMRDIEKTLDYLDNGETSAEDDLLERLSVCSKNGTTKKIPLKYFNITLYKKGTCHIEFTNLKLLDKLNIYGSQRRGWLPPSYGKKRYADMAPEEKAVVDEFQGEAAYNKVMCNPAGYIIAPKAAVPMLTEGA